jgi:hypothetical protein
MVRIMSADLKNGTAQIVYNGRAYSADHIREKLARDLASCKRCTEELKAREELLGAKQKGLEAAREQVADMRVQKEQLEVRIAQLDAEMKTLRVAQTQSKFQLDDSRLANIKGQLADIQNRLKAEKLAGELNGAFTTDPVEAEARTPTAAQLTREAEEFLGGDNSKPQGELVSKK